MYCCVQFAVAKCDSDSLCKVCADVRSSALQVTAGVMRHPHKLVLCLAHTEPVDTAQVHDDFDIINGHHKLPFHILLMFVYQIHVANSICVPDAITWCAGCGRSIL
jgi:hypothetical protein